MARPGCPRSHLSLRVGEQEGFLERGRLAPCWLLQNVLPPSLASPGCEGPGDPCPPFPLWYEGGSGSTPPVSLQALSPPSLGPGLLCLQDCALASVRPPVPLHHGVENSSEDTQGQRSLSQSYMVTWPHPTLSSTLLPSALPRSPHFPQGLSAFALLVICPCTPFTLLLLFAGAISLPPGSLLLG